MIKCYCLIFDFEAMATFYVILCIAWHDVLSNNESKILSLSTTPFSKEEIFSLYCSISFTKEASRHDF